MEKLLFAAIQMETSQNDCCRAFPLNHPASEEPLSKMMPSGKLSSASAAAAVAPSLQHAAGLGLSSGPFLSEHLCWVGGMGVSDE